MANYTQELVTDVDKKPLLIILTWITLIVAILAMGMRVGMRLVQVKSLRSDDWMIVMSTVNSLP